MGPHAQWRESIGEKRFKPPFKAGWNPLMKLPGMSAEQILPDSCHSFHLGCGIDLASSGVVLLCKRGFFGNARVPLDDRLLVAYTTYTRWVHSSGKTTGVDWWSKRKLGMGSHLDNGQHCLMFGLVWRFREKPPHLRDNNFPDSLGSCNSKAHDTALVCGWLEAFLQEHASRLRVPLREIGFANSPSLRIAPVTTWCKLSRWP